MNGREIDSKKRQGREDREKRDAEERESECIERQKRKIGRKG